MLLLAVSSAWACRDEYDFSEEARMSTEESKKCPACGCFPVEVKKQDALFLGWPAPGEWTSADWVDLFEALTEAKQRMMHRRSR